MSKNTTQKPRAKWLAIITTMLLSGCASQLQLTYHSDPAGAVLYSQGQRVGYTPKTLYYQVSDEDKKRGFLILANTRVQWASGATAEAKSVRADISRYGLSQQMTFQRPTGVPGREADTRFALELERTRAMQRQAEAHQEQAAALQRQAAAQEDQAAALQRQATAQEARLRAERDKARLDALKPPQRVDCTTTVLGGSLNTSCY